MIPYLPWHTNSDVGFSTTTQLFFSVCQENWELPSHWRQLAFLCTSAPIKPILLWFQKKKRFKWAAAGFKVPQFAGWTFITWRWVPMLWITVAFRSSSSSLMPNVHAIMSFACQCTQVAPTEEGEDRKDWSREGDTEVYCHPSIADWLWSWRSAATDNRRSLLDGMTSMSRLFALVSLQNGCHVQGQ